MTTEEPTPTPRPVLGERYDHGMRDAFFNTMRSRA